MDERRMRMEGRWQEVRGRIKEAWGSLTDDDIDRTEGRWDQLVGTIRRRTGESIDNIERRLDEMMDDERT